MGNRSYQLNSAGRSANHGQISRHWLAGNSCFLRQRVFISFNFEPLGIKIEGLNSLLLGIQLFIQIYFDGLSSSDSMFTSICHFYRKSLSFLCLVPGKKSISHKEQTWLSFSKTMVDATQWTNEKSLK